MTDRSTTETEALQRWLALEHEAVWFYPVVGARLAGSAREAARSYEAHLAVRDALLARLHDLDAVPVATALAYDSGDTRDKGKARAAARQLEQRVASACLTAVSVTSGRARTFAMDGLRRAALADLTWGGEPEAFPGLP